MREITPGSIVSSTQYGYLKVPKRSGHSARVVVNKESFH